MFPKPVQVILTRVQQIIREEAPEALETIRYGLPTYRWQGNLVHFGAFARHLGLYPGPTTIAAFRMELTAYKFSKGAIQFPLDQPIPYELIRRIVRYRVDEARGMRR